MFICFSLMVLGKENIICFVPKELKNNKNTRLVYEDTEKHKNEEIIEENTLEIVKVLLEKRVVVFKIRCENENEMYN